MRFSPPVHAGGIQATFSAENRQGIAVPTHDDPDLVEHTVQEALAKTVPHDMRGPLWSGDPEERWHGQKFRINSGHWANAGGKNRDRYDLWRSYGKKEKNNSITRTINMGIGI